jgi:hypothetical protein
VYTNDWGWYWAEGQEEAAWGWATYHYGRWALDPEFGWVWIPGDEWGPAFVEWRGCAERTILWPPRRDCVVGWAPLPPEAIVAEFVDQPDFWVFARLGDFATAPRMSAVILPFERAPMFLQQTVVVNQTVLVRERGAFAVNPGIPAGIVAAAIGRPLRTFDVRPCVLAGTANIPGAMVVSPQDLRNAGRNRNAILQPNVQQSANVIAPATRAPQIKPLARGEHGRLGDNPPRAATGTLQHQRQPGQAQQQPLPPPQQGRQPPSQPLTQGQGPRPPQREEGHALPAARPMPPPQTEGRREIAPQRPVPQQSERRSVDVPRARMEEPRARPQPPRSLPSATEGRGGGAPPHVAPVTPAVPHAAPAVPHAAPPAAAAPHAVPAPAAPPAHAAPPAAAGGGPHHP